MMIKMVFLEGEPTQVAEVAKSMGLHMNGATVSGALPAPLPKEAKAAPAEKPAAAKQEALPLKEPAKVTELPPAKKAAPAEAPKKAALAATPSPKKAAPAAAPKKAAPPPEEEEDDEVEAAEDEDEDEEEDEEEDEDGEDEEDEPDDAVAHAANGNGAIDPNAKPLQEAKRLRDVVRYLVDTGHDDPDEIVAICESIKAEVPLLARVSDIPTRVRSAFDLLVKG